MSNITWKKCRVCANPNFKSIIDLGFQPLSGVFPNTSAPDPILGRLHLVKCDTEKNPNACGLVQLEDSADITSMYGATYGYYPSISPMMQSHLEKKTLGLKQLTQLQKGDWVLDIGCNDGTLLNAYQESSQLRRVGIDPSSKKFHHNFQKDINAIFEIFSVDSVKKISKEEKFKIITSIAMFYDIDDPLTFMQGIASLLHNDGVWALELSYLPLLLEQLTYDQICHEHVTYYGLADLQKIMRKVGLKIIDIDFNDLNGGSIYVIAGLQNCSIAVQEEKIKTVLDKEKALEEFAPYERFYNRTVSHREDILEFLNILKLSNKKIYGYGASTKGNIVMNYCGLTSADIIAISDKNPEKYSLTTPGTRIQIIPHAKLREIKPEYVFVNIWHLRREVLADEVELLESGTKFVFPLPRIHIVDRNNYKRYMNRDFKDIAYTL